MVGFSFCRPAENTLRACERDLSRNSPGGGGAPDDGGGAHYSRPVGHQAAAADRRRRRRRRGRRGRRQAAERPPRQHHGAPLRQQRIRAEELTSAVHVVAARAHQRRTRRTHVVERRDRRTRRRPVGADAALHAAALRFSRLRPRALDVCSLYFWHRAREGEATVGTPDAHCCSPGLSRRPILSHLLAPPPLEVQKKVQAPLALLRSNPFSLL